MFDSLLKKRASRRLTSKLANKLGKRFDNVMVERLSDVGQDAGKEAMLKKMKAQGMGAAFIKNMKSEAAEKAAKKTAGEAADETAEKAAREAAEKAAKSEARQRILRKAGAPVVAAAAATGIGLAAHLEAEKQKKNCKEQCNAGELEYTNVAEQKMTRCGDFYVEKKRGKYVTASGANVDHMFWPVEQRSETLWESMVGGGPVAVSEAKDELCGDPNISGDAVAKCYETKLQECCEAHCNETTSAAKVIGKQVGEVGGELGAAAGNVIAETGSGLVQGLNVEKLLKDLKGNSMFFWLVVALIGLVAVKTVMGGKSGGPQTIVMDKTATTRPGFERPVAPQYAAPPPQYAAPPQQYAAPPQQG